MAIDLLPAAFDDLVTKAVMTFWSTRSKGSDTQGGTRGNVIAGKNLDGFIEVVRAVADHCGIPSNAVFTKGRRDLTIPGYFRPVKNWDAVVVYQKRLVAVFEFKSQVGSFGNNFNNRTEEVLGNATDLWAAHSKGAYDPDNYKLPLEPTGNGDPRPPFVGYLMLLQACEGSTRPVGINSPHYEVFPEFKKSSYADRYRLLCERLMEEHLYSAATLMLSEQASGLSTGAYRHASEATTVHNLFRVFAGQAAAAAS